MTASVILWFRRDLRLTDNTALNAALESGAPVIPLFIFDPRIIHGERSSANRTAFLHAGLEALDADLRARGTRLLVRVGDPLDVLPQVMAETGASALYFNRDYSPYARKRDKAVFDALSGGVSESAPDARVRTFHDVLLHAPTTVMTGAGKPYTVFTPFKRTWLDKPKAPAYTAQAGRFHPVEVGDIPPLDALGVGRPTAAQTPPAGEGAAQRRLDRFVRHALYRYDDTRDAPYPHPWLDEAQGTSGLSPYLRLGMLSVRQAYHAAAGAREEADTEAQRKGADTWISELCWRDFYAHVLYHFPHVYNTSFKAQYEAVAFRSAPDELEAWKAGQTGYPIVDAAMRQLQQSGWVHNRARMIVASFLTKDLLIYWREGDVHFMRHLHDGDPAANNGGWQWAAGTGTDAQPYFRIFNPVSQSQKFDPRGEYIRALVPELRDVPERFIHAPWEMPTPPKNYPTPIVDHKAARARTLAAFKAAGDPNPEPPTGHDEDED